MNVEIDDLELTYGQLPVSLVDRGFGRKWKLSDKTGLMQKSDVEKILKKLDIKGEQHG